MVLLFVTAEVLLLLMMMVVVLVVMVVTRVAIDSQDLQPLALAECLGEALDFCHAQAQQQQGTTTTPLALAHPYSRVPRINYSNRAPQQQHHNSGRTTTARAPQQQHHNSGRTTTGGGPAAAARCVGG